MTRATLVYFVVFSVGLVLLMPLALGIKLGISLVRHRPQWDVSWLLMPFIALVLWPTAAGLPWAGSYLQLRLRATAGIPQYAGAQRSYVKVSLGDNENTADRIRLGYTTDSDSAAVLRFYGTELVERGWRAGPEFFVERRSEGTPHWFSRPDGRSLYIKFDSTPSLPRIRYEVVYTPPGLSQLLP